MKPQESWNLNQKHPDRGWFAYALMAALRGPDHQGSSAANVFKHVFTERFRGIVFREPECGGSWREDRLWEPEVELVRNTLRSSVLSTLNHYLIHVRMALEATIEHPIWGGHGDELVSMLRAKEENP